MKALICSFTAISLLAGPSLAEDDNLIEAKLISTTISQGLPEGIPLKDRPYIRNKGAELVFYFQADNIASFDKESFHVAGWDKNFQSNISSSGKTATITIFNKNFKGIFEEIEAEGRVDVLIGTESVTKKHILKKDAEPIELPFFTMELLLDEDNNNGFDKSGVTVIGKHSMISKISILRDGKEISSNGYSSSNDTKTFRFRGIKDGDEIKVIYWSKIKTRTVKIYK